MRKGGGQRVRGTQIKIGTGRRGNRWIGIVNGGFRGIRLGKIAMKIHFGSPRAP